MDLALGIDQICVGICPVGLSLTCQPFWAKATHPREREGDARGGGLRSRRRKSLQELP